ncbi:unnamed protein product, partial [Mesorhabditis belari]|uniref:Uncharacterized protein n=1 Tax=Mesorhabditis belari TaxID=2138241 RepID=A0AAF3FBV4_9BILA
MTGVNCMDPEERLMIDLFRGYNSYLLPIRNFTDLPVQVKIAMQLVLLVNVDELNQRMHTNVWLTMRWRDYQLTWNPDDYDGITSLRVQPEKIWLPDIVLFNNADGNYEVSFMCNAVIHYNGQVQWVPPAIYQSSCIMDVEFFPFDYQVCNLIFGSWTYSREEVRLDFEHSDYVDVSEYTESTIWDLVDAPAVLVEDRSRIEFQIKIRRKPLFYTVVLILPTILMAFLNVTVFYLPTASGEKMGLTMNVLLSIVVFLLLVSKRLPPTSNSIPLVAKYLLLTFLLNVITIVITVVICNIYFRSPLTHRLPPWVRTVFLKWLPSILCMKRPPLDQKHLKRPMIPPRHPGPPLLPQHHHPFCKIPENPEDSDEGPSIRLCPYEPDEELSPDAQRTVDAIDFITEGMRDDELTKNYRDDWQYVSMVVDRFFLYTFLGITIGGTVGIIFSAPDIFTPVDQKEKLAVLRELMKCSWVIAGFLVVILSEKSAIHAQDVQIEQASTPLVIISISTPASIPITSPSNPSINILPITSSSPIPSQTTRSGKKKRNRKTPVPRPALPFFLQLANDTQRKEYVDLETNPNVEKGIKSKALQAWATRCGSNVTIAYQAFLADQTLIQEKRQQQLDAIVSKLSASAQAIHEKINTVVDNDNISSAKENQQLAKIKKKADPSVWNELETAVGLN